MGIGASAGGLEPLERFLTHVPAKSGLAFVVVQHLERHHPSMLVEILGRHTQMPVLEAKDEMKVASDHVYVIAPNTSLTVEKGQLRVGPPADTGSQALIDRFLRSLAEDQDEHAVGIILSGSGSDGTVGMRAIKEYGGLTLAQSPETTPHDSMPRNAIEAGLVDLVLPVEQMPARLLEHARHLVDYQRSGAQALDEELAGHLGQICSALQQRTGHDFSHYKRGTLMRRIRRRLQVQHAASADDYLKTLAVDASEADRLLKDLLIGVTHFFRDLEAFNALATEVIPRLVESNTSDAPIRVWVPGCASGEEAYSIAILLREHLEKLSAQPFVQIFATDIDTEMLAEARRGRYGGDIAEHVSPERLAHFFTHEGSQYSASKELREMCIFSQHSLIRDPPFSNLGLISCRNVLIYLEPDLQKNLVPLFHYALGPGGHLFLGPSESLAAHSELFETVDKRHRIFRRKETVVRPVVEFPLTSRGRSRPAHPLPGTPTARELPEASLQQKVSAAFERMVMGEYAAPCAVVNARGEMVLVAGKIGRFLEPPVGAVTNNLVDVVPNSLRVDLRMALQTASVARRKVVRDNLPVELDDGIHRVRLTVRPVPGLEPEAGLLAVVIQEHAPLERPEETDAPPAAPEQPALDRLESELRTTRAELKTTVEDLESANEELKSSNEELLSTNEELQSANEEMQTSREELQSLNEELETVNAELQQKVEDLATANSVLQNLFSSTEIATIFLDRDLRIARFTPAATQMFHLLEGDVGRAIGDFAPRFDGQDVVADAREVLRTLSPIERQVRAAHGDTWFILRVLPYRTVENVIDGVVVTFVDVSELKKAEESLRASEERFRLLVEGVKDYAILMLAPDGTVATWNSGAERLNGYSAKEIVGQHFSRFYSEQDRQSGRPQMELKRAAEEGRAEDEGWRIRKDGSRFWANVLVTALRDRVGNLRGFANITRDFTERKAAEARLAYLASYPEKNPNPIVEADIEGLVKYANPAAQRLFPDLRERAGAHPWLAGWEELVRSMRGNSARVESREVAAGERIFHQVILLAPGGELVRTYGLDITARKRAEEALRGSEERFRTMADAIPQLAWMAQADGYIYWYNERWYQYTGTTPEQMEGWGWQSVHDPQALPKVLERWKASIASGEPFDMEFPLRGADGRFRPFLTRVLPLKDAEGRVLQWFGTNTEITEMAEIRAELKRERDFSSAVIETAGALVVVLDREGRIRRFNRACQATTGYSADEALGRHFDFLLAADQRAGAPKAWDALVEGNVPLSYETAWATKDGRRRVIAWSDTAIRSSDGRTEFLIGTGIDITERKAAEEELRRAAEFNERSRQGLRRLAEASLAVMAKTDIQGMLQAIAEAALALTGARLATCGHGFVSGQFVVGGSARAPGAPECPPGNMFELDRGGVHMALVEGADSVRLTDAELRSHAKWWGLPEGHVPMKGLLGVRMLARSGRTNGLLLVTDKEHGDFTDEDESLLKQLATVATLALQHVEARISLEESDRRKDEFLAMLSHELRNPLTPVRNSLYILDRVAPGGEQARRAQSIIDRQVGHMTRLVDDLLDVTRISRGKIQLRPEPLDFADVVRRAVEDHRASFVTNRVDLQVTIPSEPIWVSGDRTRIAQVIGNLLGNAAKFTQAQGEVVVSVEANQNLGQAIARVRDTGPGIAPEMLPRLFEPFTQADTTLDRSKGGLGLGLALVKGIVEMHGGTVSAESEGLGKGAAFTLRLPLQPQVSRAADRPDRARGNGGVKRVLIIEDNRDAADSLREVLELGGHRVAVAYSGPDGLEAARQFQPDVVLCDLGLPVMDGFQVARAMRAEPALRGVRLVALSGYAAPEDITRSREAGFEAHLAKPPGIDALDSVLAAGVTGNEHDPGGEP